MLINTEQDLYAACDQYQGKTITLTKPGHTAWNHLTLKAVSTQKQTGSHIPILMQVHTDRGIYSLNPPFEITQEVAQVQQHVTGDPRRRVTDQELETVRTAGVAWCSDALFDQLMAELQERRSEAVR